MASRANNRIKYFNAQEISGIGLPEKFTFPFYYEPHPLTVIASDKLKHFLQHEFTEEHNFGLNAHTEGLAIGKMFGVLVVKDTEGRLGYLWAFSGKLADANSHDDFVPPVFDMLTEDSFFIQKVKVVNEINRQIEAIETDAFYISSKALLHTAEETSAEAIEALKIELRENKQSRKKLRQAQKEILSPEEYAAYDAELIKESLSDKRRLLAFTRELTEKINSIKLAIASSEDKITALKK